VAKVAPREIIKDTSKFFLEIKKLKIKVRKKTALRIKGWLSLSRAVRNRA